MITRIAEIEKITEKLESMIKSLTKDRDEARGEVGRLKQMLDDRELELLQIDEELQKVTGERDSVIQDKQETERRLDDVAFRIKELLPLLTEPGETETPDGVSATDRNEAC